MQTLNPISVEMVKRCAELLQITFKSRDDNERKAAEQALNKLSENSDQFIQTLIALITLNESSGIFSSMPSPMLSLIYRGHRSHKRFRRNIPKPDDKDTILRRSNGKRAKIPYSQSFAGSYGPRAP